MTGGGGIFSIGGTPMDGFCMMTGATTGIGTGTSTGKGTAAANGTGIFTGTGTG